MVPLNGNAPATSGALTLTRRGSANIPIKTFQVKAIAHGAHHERTVSFKVPSTPGGLAGYTLEVKLDSKHQLQEYDEADNKASVPLP